MDINKEVKFLSVDEYLSTLPEHTRKKMMTIRSIVHEVVPGAMDVISYKMPAFRFHGILVYYAAHKEHIGFYPANVAFHKVFQEDLIGYKTSKGTIQFPISQELPVDLIRRIVSFRAEQNICKKR